MCSGRHKGGGHGHRELNGLMVVHVTVDAGHIIIDKFDGGPVGLETLAASINEDADTIMDVWEPYLLQLGFLERTPRGRVATRLAHEYLGRPYTRPEPQDQGRLTGF